MAKSVSVQNVVVKIGDKEINLTLDEARELRDILTDTFGKKVDASNIARLGRTLLDQIPRPSAPSFPSTPPFIPPRTRTLPWAPPPAPRWELLEGGM